MALYFLQTTCNVSVTVRLCDMTSELDREAVDTVEAIASSSAQTLQDCEDSCQFNTECAFAVFFVSPQTGCYLYAAEGFTGQVSSTNSTLVTKTCGQTGIDFVNTCLICFNV